MAETVFVGLSLVWEMQPREGKGASKKSSRKERIAAASSRSIFSREAGWFAYSTPRLFSGTQ